MELAHDPITYLEARKHVVKRMQLITADTIWQRPQRMAGSIVTVWMIGGGSGGTGAANSASSSIRSGAGGMTSFGTYEAVLGGASVASVGTQQAPALITGKYGKSVGAPGTIGATGAMAGLRLIGPMPVAEGKTTATGYGAGGVGGAGLPPINNGSGGLAGEFMLEYPIDIGEVASIPITIGKGGSGGTSAYNAGDGNKGNDGAVLIEWEEIV